MEQKCINYTNEKRTYTVREIADMLSLSLRTAYQLCKTTNQFKVLSLGRNVRVHKKSFDQWFSE